MMQGTTQLEYGLGLGDVVRRRQRSAVSALEPWISAQPLQSRLNLKHTH